MENGKKGQVARGKEFLNRLSPATLPTIIVIAYNRPASLHRLLSSLRQADYPPDVPLIISIDAGGENGRLVHNIAQQFAWTAGEKRVIVRKRPLGLTGHVFACGDLSQEIGPIILLEDDLIVSPMFYHYAVQTLNEFSDDDRIAGISLNTLWFNGITHTPFVPTLDDADMFFMQVSWYHGQAYTARMWQQFMQWRETASRTITPADGLHELFSTFPDSEWFPFKMKYLAQTGRFYIFPRESLTVNFGDVGTHFEQTTAFFQQPMQTFRHNFRLHSPDQSVAVYDSFQELLPSRLNRLTDQFVNYEYTTDLNGTKSPYNIPTDHLLTTQKLKNPMNTFAQLMWPLEANVITAVPGSGISFGHKSNLDRGRLATLATQSRNDAYFKRYKVNGRRHQLRLLIGNWLRKKQE